MNRKTLFLATLATLALSAAASSVSASDFPSVSGANPVTAIPGSALPLFDFDGDGCLPSAGISRYGEQNGGLNPSGSITGGCRRSDFMSYSNTLHRYACITSNSVRYCAHFYALYFLKDQTTNLGGGHRHDWEHAVLWTKAGVVTHASYSAHGNLYTRAYADTARENGRVKFVYHKDGLLTHALRFASSTEAAENPAGRFVMPTLISWYTMKGADAATTNAVMRSRLNAFDYGSAVVPVKDTGSRFLNNINNNRPSGYPAFTQTAVDNSK